MAIQADEGRPEEKVEGYKQQSAAKPALELVSDFVELEEFVSHLDVTLTSSVGPECVELISYVQRAISGLSLI